MIQHAETQEVLYLNSAARNLHSEKSSELSHTLIVDNEKNLLDMDSNVFALVDTALFNQITDDTASALEFMRELNDYKSFADVIKSQKEAKSLSSKRIYKIKNADRKKDEMVNHGAINISNPFIAIKVK